MLTRWIRRLIDDELNHLRMDIILALRFTKNGEHHAAEAILRRTLRKREQDLRKETEA